MILTRRLLWTNIPDERRDKQRGLGTLAKLPLEVQTQIWLAWAKYEHPRNTYSRLHEVSPWLEFECYYILFANRIFTFDISSYEHLPGRWPSEFPVYDQLGCRWTVSPQFGGDCSTLAGAENLASYKFDFLEHINQIKIRVPAPRDAGETLMLWNRMRWIVTFISRGPAWRKETLHVEFIERHDRSWWRVLPDKIVPQTFSYAQ
jgi:hypothetical protein